MKKLFLNIWIHIRYSNVDRTVMSLVIWAIFQILANFYDVFFYISWIFMIYPAALFITMMVYAWIINPYHDWKEWRKRKKNK